MCDRGSPAWLWMVVCLCAACACSWRSGLADWVALSSLPELRGIFSTAFDAPDETPTPAGAAKKSAAAKGKHTNAAASGAAGNAAASSSAALAASPSAASAASAVPADPLAVWFYLDKYRAQQGPVRHEEIVRLYKMLQINDATMVWSAMAPPAAAAAAAAPSPSSSATAASSSAASASASVASSASPAGSAGAGTGTGGWVRVAECAAFAESTGPEVLEQSRAEREAFLSAAEATKKRKRDRAAAKEGSKWKASSAAAAANNSNVYFTGLPRDVTAEELCVVAKKAGIIQEDEAGAKRIKIYCDDQGKPKGDALVKYALPASVDLAITLLDQSVFRLGKVGEAPVVIGAQRAEFHMKGASFDASKVDPKVLEKAALKRAKLAGGALAAEALKAQVGALTSKEIQKQKLAESLSWAEEDGFGSAAGGSSKLKIVILKPMFTLAEAAAHPDGPAAFYAELKDEIGTEVEAKVSVAAAAAVAAASDDGGGAGRRGGGNAASQSCIEKLTVFAGNAAGPVAIKFRSSAHAAACIALMNGRMFAGQKLAAFYFDGKTNYVVEKKEESKEEEDRRLKEFGDWIEKGDGDEQEE